MKKGQNQKSLTRQNLISFSSLRSLLSTIKNWGIRNQVNLQIAGSVAFIVGVLSGIGGVHG